MKFVGFVLEMKVLPKGICIRGEIAIKRKLIFPFYDIKMMM